MPSSLIASAAGPDGVSPVDAATLHTAAAPAAGTAGVSPFGSMAYEQLDGQVQADSSNPAYQQTAIITEVPTMPSVFVGAAPRAGQRVSMTAGATTTVTPTGTTTTMHGQQAAAAPDVAEVVVESPTAAAANARAVGATPVTHVDNHPKVDSPGEDLDMGMNDFLQNLHSMNSSELMLTDDVNKDDLWDMLFGGQQQPSGAGTSGHGLHGYDIAGKQFVGIPGAPASLQGADHVGSPTLPAFSATGIPTGAVTSAGLPVAGMPDEPLAMDEMQAVGVESSDQHVSHAIDASTLDPAMAAALTVPGNLLAGR